MSGSTRSHRTGESALKQTKKEKLFTITSHKLLKCTCTSNYCFTLSVTIDAVDLMLSFLICNTYCKYVLLLASHLCGSNSSRMQVYNLISLCSFIFQGGSGGSNMYQLTESITHRLNLSCN